MRSLGRALLWLAVGCLLYYLLTYEALPYLDRLRGTP